MSRSKCPHDVDQARFQVNGEGIKLDLKLDTFGTGRKTAARKAGTEIKDQYYVVLLAANPGER